MDSVSNFQSDREQSIPPTKINNQMPTDLPIDYNIDNSLPERREPHRPNSNHCPGVRQRTPVALPALLTNGVSHKMRRLLQSMDREVSVTATKKGHCRCVKAAVQTYLPSHCLNLTTAARQQSPVPRKCRQQSVSEPEDVWSTSQDQVWRSGEMEAMVHRPHQLGLNSWCLIGQSCARYERIRLWIDVWLDIHAHTGG